MKLTTGNCIRLTAQLVAAAGAVWGLPFLYIAATMMFIDPGWFSIGLGLVAFLFGAVLLLVAYEMIWRYSVQSVKLFSFVAAFLLHAEIQQLLDSYQDHYWEEKMIWAYDAVMGGPIVLAVLFYFVLRNFLIATTGLKESLPAPHEPGKHFQIRRGPS